MNSYECEYAIGSARVYCDLRIDGTHIGTLYFTPEEFQQFRSMLEMGAEQIIIDRPTVTFKELK